MGELEKVARLMWHAIKDRDDRIQQLEEALREALLHWRQAENATALEENWIENSNDDDALLYKQLCAILSSTKVAEGE